MLRFFKLEMEKWTATRMTPAEIEGNIKKAVPTPAAALPCTSAGLTIFRLNVFSAHEYGRISDDQRSSCSLEAKPEDRQE
jgi:hypothetical protein